jgi:hypothetical protein
MRFNAIRAFAALTLAFAAASGCTREGASPSAPATLSGYRLLAAPAAPASAGSRSLLPVAPVSAVIGPDGGALVLADGSRLDVPAGAVAEPTQFSMSPASGLYGVELQPHGLAFPAGHEPVLTLPYAPLAAAGFTRIAVVYVDDTRTIVEVLPSDNSGASATAHLHHFSGYAVGGT